MAINLNLLLAMTVEAGPAKAVLTAQAGKSLHAKHLAVSLALAVACADQKASAFQLKAIKNYIKKDIAPKRISLKTAYFLKLLFHHFIAADFNRCRMISKQISEITDFAGRCDVLDFCMRVVGISDIATIKQLMLLKDIAEQLGIENETFRVMLEKIIPVSKHEYKDFETILGITSDMNADEANSQLGKEYIKWNNRVTNSNPQIRKQAQDMLKFIAKAKSLTK